MILKPISPYYWKSSFDLTIYLEIGVIVAQYMEDEQAMHTQELKIKISVMHWWYFLNKD